MAARRAKRGSMALMLRVTCLCAVAALAVQVAPVEPRAAVADRVTRLTRETAWTSVQSVPIAFRTFHPQGMVKIGATFFLSSVEVLDRDAGRGTGHLFKMNSAGTLLADLKLGEGAMYHPGGLDYDGKHIWVAVAEYRPDSRSIIYRVDPDAMTAVEVFRFADHIGAIVHDTDDNALHGVSWGSRHFYRWPIGRDGRVTNASASPAALRVLNPSHYVDYQDCKYAGQRRMLCTGVTEMRQSAEAAPFRLGGLELISLRDGRPLHQVPILLWTANGLDMTHNPAWLESTVTGLRGYFIPGDDSSTLYVYEAVTP